MFDYWWKKLYPKIYKKPCYVCLTQAICQSKQPWLQNCDTKREWEIKQYTIGRHVDTIENFLCLVIVIITTLFFVGTFVLGLWKWWELFSKIFS